MKAIYILILFTIPIAYVNSQSLQGIKKAVVLKYESDGIKNLGVTPDISILKNKIQNHIIEIEIAEMISNTAFENASISIYYDIFKDNDYSDKLRYYGAVRLEVRRNVVDSRFTPPLFEPTVYKDFIYVLFTNPDNVSLIDKLDKHTDAIISDFAKYYYMDNPK